MLDGYVSEKEQIESIKKWWIENGKFIAIAIVLGLCIGYAWRYFHRFENKRAENAAMIYQSVLNADAEKNTVTAQGGAKILMDNFASTPYASLAALLWAKEAVTQNNLSLAFNKYQWIIKNSGQHRLQQIARISSARILLAQHHPKQALSELNVVNDKQFVPLIAWVKGDIFTQQGHKSQAQKSYQIAKDAFAQFKPAVDMLDQLLAQPM